MQWYVIHTKFRQEEHALLNLKRQGYECFLPMLAVEQMRQKALRVIEQPLFPRYLFIQLDVHGSGKSWGPIRSTKGVSRLVMFGSEPAWLDDGIVAALRARIAAASRDAEPIFAPGDRLMIFEGPFAGIEAVFQMTDGDRRAIVLIDMLRTSMRLRISNSSLRKIG